MLALRASALLLALAALGSCGIPPYSSIRDQPLRGLHSVKVRGTLSQDLTMIREDYNTEVETKSEIDTLYSWALELERSMGAQWTANFALEARRLEPRDTFPHVTAKQLRGGVRRYFGDRALTAFASAELIYGLGFDFAGDKRDSEGYLGWAAGGGVNLALNEDFSIEVLVLYEGMPRADAYLDPEAPPEGNYTTSGPVAYFALGWHF